MPTRATRKLTKEAIRESLDMANSVGVLVDVLRRWYPNSIALALVERDLDDVQEEIEALLKVPDVENAPAPPAGE